MRQPHLLPKIKLIAFKLGSLTALYLLIGQTPLLAEENQESEEKFFPLGTYIGLSIGLTGHQGGNINHKVEGPGKFDTINRSYWQQNSLDAINSALANTSGQHESRGNLIIGHNFKFDDFIVSPSASISRGFSSTINTSVGKVQYSNGSIYPIEMSQKIDPKFNLDASIRIGYPIKKFMPYVLAGPSLSVADITNKFTDSWITAENNIYNTVSWGYSIGGGVEYMLNKKSSIKIEYIYSKYSLAESHATGDWSGVTFDSDKTTFSGNYYQGALWIGGIFRLQ